MQTPVNPNVSGGRRSGRAIFYSITTSKGRIISLLRLWRIKLLDGFLTQEIIDHAGLPPSKDQFEGRSF